MPRSSIAAMMAGTRCDTALQCLSSNYGHPTCCLSLLGQGKIEASLGKLTEDLSPMLNSISTECTSLFSTSGFLPVNACLICVIFQT